MSFLEAVFFSKAKPLMRKGQKVLVGPEDQVSLPQNLYPEVQDERSPLINWDNARSLYFSFIKYSKKLFITIILFQVLSSLFSLTTPIALNQVITRLQKLSRGSDLWNEVYVYPLIGWAVLLALCAIGYGVFVQHYFYRALNFFQITSQLIEKKIYKHSLRLSNTSKQKYQVGDIVNLMSADAEAVGNMSITTVDMVNAIMIIVFGSAALFYYMGWSAIVALVLMAVLGPTLKKVGRRFSHLEDAMMLARDRRMSLLTQAVNAIRLIKYYSWERSIEKQIGHIRQEEINARIKLIKEEVLWSLLFAAVSTIVLFSTLFVHYLRGEEITLPLVMTCLAYFSIMEDQFGGLSRFMSHFMNIFVSGNRITSFLKSETVEDMASRLDRGGQKIINGEAVPRSDDSVATKNSFISHSGVKVQTQVEVSSQSLNEISVQNVDFSYLPDAKLIQNLNFQIKAHESVAIVGPVGSGKTTILQLLLGECDAKAGQVSFPHQWSVGYVSQEPYIINASLKKNIVFGLDDYKEEDLKNAIKLSCLEEDLKLFPHGLDTEIGEKGVNLSGGQKQRVTLARAILNSPDCILMDDPLSAVDPKTEQKLVQNLIFGHWKNKTRIVVTHRLKFIHHFDKILFVGSEKTAVGTDSEIAFGAGQGIAFGPGPRIAFGTNQKIAFGSYEELLKNNVEFKNYLDLEVQNQENEVKVNDSAGLVKTDSTSLNDDSSSRITVDEDQEKGAVKVSVFKSYVSALGGSSRYKKWILTFLFLVTALMVFAPLLQKLWLTQSAKGMDTAQLVYGYGILGLLTLSITYFYTRFWAERGIVAGKEFHDKSLSSVLKTEVRFFDSTPVGRILQRFSRDVESVDVHLSWSFESTMRTFSEVLVSFFLIVVTLPISIVVLVPLLLYYYRIQKQYRQVAREVKRLDSVSRSPKYAHFKETLQGLNVIRAYKKEPWFLSEFYKKMQKANQAYFTHYYINRWFSVKLPILGSLITFVTVMSVIYSTYKSWLSLGIASLVILYAIDFWRYLNWGIRIFSDLESRMTSVERLSFYKDLPAEKEFFVAEQIENFVPENGELEFQNVSLRYADHLPEVLKNVSFKIASGAKAGIIGRTGSGKSTLFQAVYRFVHYHEGDIKVSGRSIRGYTLENLRRSMAVIPQDPSLFIGTLRSNIDHEGLKTDDEIYQVLALVGLRGFVKSLPEKLDEFVTENGSNFSQGQRQLICLARALLMQVKIIFLDEATASVDVETDQKIQKVIHSYLDGITLVTIAHRLSTLKNYDQLIELDKGRVVNSVLLDKAPVI